MRQKEENLERTVSTRIGTLSVPFSYVRWENLSTRLTVENFILSLIIYTNEYSVFEGESTQCLCANWMSGICDY